ncbi:MAG: recombinase family protein [Acidobacteria bacterium]|nr:recombinase family protein [Acidobacteriota bacterium]
MDFISLSESIDTSTPMGKMVYTIIAAVAELERSLIRERVVMGLQRARAQGKKLGRPKVKANKAQLVRLHEQGLSSREVAKQLGLSPSTVLRRLRAASKTC